MATARSGERATSRPSMCERKTACFLGHLDEMGEAEQLESAAVGQDRAVPAHEAVQPAQRGDRLFAGPQREMIGVAQDHLRPGGAELFDLQALDAGLGADRHEGRHLHVAVRRREDRPASSERASVCSRRKEKMMMTDDEYVAVAL